MDRTQVSNQPVRNDGIDTTVNWKLFDAKIKYLEQLRQYEPIEMYHRHDVTFRISELCDSIEKDLGISSVECEGPPPDLQNLLKP